MERDNVLFKNEAANLIEAFIENRGGDYDWDDFISINNPTLRSKKYGMIAENYKGNTLQFILASIATNRESQF